MEDYLAIGRSAPLIWGGVRVFSVQSNFVTWKLTSQSAIKNNSCYFHINLGDADPPYMSGSGRGNPCYSFRSTSCSSLEVSLPVEEWIGVLQKNRSATGAERRRAKSTQKTGDEMLERKSTILLAAAAFAVAACQSLVEERPATAELATPDRPDWTVGFKLVQANPTSGEEQSWSVLDVGDETVTAFNHNTGCKWVNHQDWFAPVLQWNNCGGNSGSRTITSIEGQIWPLEVGNKIAYRFQNAGGGGGVRRCEVKGTANIDVNGDAIDAYKVVCRDSNRTRTWFGHPIAARSSSHVCTARKA